MDNVKFENMESDASGVSRKPFTAPKLKQFQTPKLLPLGSMSSVVLGTAAGGNDIGSHTS
jgi:hypothetical protein